MKITRKQVQQFNRMLSALRRIAREYQTPPQMRRSCEKAYGLHYEEGLEMAYENLQAEATDASKGVKFITETEPGTDTGGK